MTAILAQSEVFEQEQEEFSTVSTTFNNRTAQKFPNRPIAIVRSVRSIAQTSAKDIDDARSYYLSPRLIDYASIFLPPQPYELRTIEDQSKELRSDDIAVHALTHSTVRQNVSFAQPLSSLRRGRFLFSLLHSSSVHLPQPKSKLQDSELDEGQAVWRGVFPLSNSTKVLFSENIEIRVDELPVWKPNVVIDSYRLEDDDE